MCLTRVLEHGSLWTIVIGGCTMHCKIAQKKKKKLQNGALTIYDRKI